MDGFASAVGDMEFKRLTCCFVAVLIVGLVVGGLIVWAVR